MKHLKILGLGLMAASALMAFVGAGTASATILEREGGEKMTNGREVHAILEGDAELPAGFITVQCKESTIAGTVKNEGSATNTVIIETRAVTFTICNCEPITVSNGTLEIHSISGTPGSGTLTASGLTFTIPCSTIFGKVTCKYITGNNRHMGTLIGSTDNAGLTATMKVNVILTREEPSNGLCAAEVEWKANYVVTTPDVLNVTAS